MDAYDGLYSSPCLLPWQVTLEFVSRDLPSSYNSGVNTSLCWLDFTGSSGGGGGRMSGELSEGALCSINSRTLKPLEDEPTYCHIWKGLGGSSSRASLDENLVLV